jgi:lysyl-tRNA synthetase class I
MAKKKSTKKSAQKENTKQNPKDPTQHPIVKAYQEMVQDAIDDIYNHYSNYMPKEKANQIEKLKENIRTAPYWLQNLMEPEFKKYRLDKEDPYDSSKMVENK